MLTRGTAPLQLASQQQDSTALPVVSRQRPVQHQPDVAPPVPRPALNEDYAMADILTGGRVVFGVGRGYHSREVDTFGAPSTLSDNEANREMFEEQVEIMMKAFHEESFSYQGV